MSDKVVFDNFLWIVWMAFFPPAIIFYKINNGIKSMTCLVKCYDIVSVFICVICGCFFDSFPRSCAGTMYHSFAAVNHLKEEY